MNKRNEILQKLKRDEGSTLVEMLVTVLLISLVTTAIASSAGAVHRVYRDIRRKADAQTLMSTVVNAISEDLYYARDVEVGGDADGKTVSSFYSENRYYRMTFRNSTESTGGTSGTGGTAAGGGSDSEGSTSSDSAPGILRIKLADTNKADSGDTGSGTGGAEEAAADTSEDTTFPLVTQKTQSLGLYAKLKNGLQYDKGCFTFTVQIYLPDGQTVVEEQEIKVHSVLVRENTSS